MSPIFISSQKVLHQNYIIRLRVLHLSKRQFINETDSSTASRKLMKSHLTKHVQDLYNLSMQYIDLKLLLYSNSGIVLGNTLINIPQRSLSKRRYLSFKTKNQKIVNLKDS